MLKLKLKCNTQSVTNYFTFNLNPLFTYMCNTVSVTVRSATSFVASGTNTITNSNSNTLGPKLPTLIAIHYHTHTDTLTVTLIDIFKVIVISYNLIHKS